MRKYKTSWKRIDAISTNLYHNKMNYSEMKGHFLKSFIGFLILTAVIAIITVISGEFGDIQARILGTTFTISIASICAMSCAAFIEKRNFKVVGITGIAFSLLSAILIIAEIWGSVGSNLYYKIIFTSVACAFSFAHGLLLFLPQLDTDREWVQQAAAITITVLLAQIIFWIWLEIEHTIYFRMMTVIAILVGLETLVIPILMKLKKGNSEQKETLELENVDGHIYKDASGKLYDVREKR